jgi:hypothetical protein
MGGQTAAALAATVPVRGRVEDASGRPVRDAVLRLYPLVGSYAAGELQLAGAFPPPAKAEAKTDAEGSFRLEAPGPGVWRLVASAAGKAPREAMLQPLLEETWLAAAVLPADAPLEVHVVDAAGAPVASAPVVAQSTNVSWRTAWRPATARLAADAQGVAVVHRGSGERLNVGAAGPSLALVETKDVGGSSLRVVLPKGSPRLVTVAGPDGRPAAGAMVSTARGGLPLGRSGPGGRVTLAVAGSEPIELEVEDGSGASARLTLVPAPPNERPRPLAVRLERAVSLSGRVIDSTSRQPIAGAVLFESRQPETVAIADGAGAYTLEKVRVRGGAWLRAAAAGYFGSDLSLPEPVARGGRAPTVALDLAGRLAGTVVDPGGRPLAGVEVASAPAPSGTMRGFRRMGRLAAWTSQTRTDERGRFRLSPWPNEIPSRVTFRHPGYASRVEVVPPGPAEPPAELHVTLQRGARGVGRVVTAAGAPIAGAKASLERQEESPTGRRIFMQGQEQKAAAETLSDAGGRFVLADLAPGRFVLKVEAEGFAATAVPGIEVPEVGAPLAGGPATAGRAASPPPGDVDLGTVKLAPGAAVEGRVIGPRGEPIGDAEVFVLSGMGAMLPNPRWAITGKTADATSAADGVFRVSDRARGERVDLAVRRTGYTVGRLVGVVAPTDEPVTVTLQPASDVRGRVVAEGGDPVAGAQVALLLERAGGGMAFQLMAGNASTGDDGRFVLEDVEPGSVRVSVSADGFLPYERSGVEVPAGRDVEGLELVLRPGATVEGVVTAPDGRPAIGAAVRVVAEGSVEGNLGRFTMGAAEAESDGDGRYRLEGVEPGPRTLEATHERYDRGVASLEVRPGENRLDVRLGGGQEVSGRVIGAGGQPVAGATVALSPPGMRWWSGERSATTDAAGLFEIPGVPDGTYDATASHPEHAEGRSAAPVTVAGAPVLGLTIELPAGGVIAGALEGLSLAELGQTRVTAFQEGKGSREGTVSYDGRYRIAGLAPGDWGVFGRVEGGGRQAQGRATLAAGEAEESLDLDFKGGLVVTGRVRYQAKPVDGAIVTFQGQDVASAANTRTDFAGSFRAENLEPGSYRLEVYVPQSGLRHGEALTLDGNREIEVELRSYRVAGTVLDAASDDPIAGALVRVEPVEPQEIDRMPRFGDGVDTDDAGRFALATTSEGSWRLTAQKAGYAKGELVVQVTGQPVEGVEVHLQPTQGLTVRVARVAGAPPADVRVAVLDGAGRVVTHGSFPTGEGGTVRLSSVPAGSWDLLVRSDDSATARVAATSPGPPVGVLLAPQATMTIVVPELEGSQAIVPVTLTGPDGRPFVYPDWGGAESTIRLRYGRAVVSYLPAGTWTLRVTTPGGSSLQATATTTAGAGTTVELR